MFEAIELRSQSVEDTRAIAAVVASVSRSGDLIVLAGEMGAGKTAFAQGFAIALGVTEPVTSPTYTLVHTYPSAIELPSSISTAGKANRTPNTNTNSVTLHHADLYRLEHTTEVEDLALDELRDGTVMLVEWGDMVDLGANVQVELRAAVDDDHDERAVTITANDQRWQTRWDRLAADLQRWAA